MGGKDTRTPVDGLAAAQNLLNFGKVTPGYCLHYVWQAYAMLGATTTSGQWPTAYSGWLGSAGQHPGDWNPPPGVPVYFGPKASSSAGDVVISTGDGNCAATDFPYGGVTGMTTLVARQKQISRPYLGWTETILNYPILQAQPPAPVVPPNIGGNMFLIYDADAGRDLQDIQYILVTADGGQLRGYYLEDPFERAVVVGQYPNLAITACDAATFNGFLARIGYAYQQPVPLVRVLAELDEPADTRR